MYEESRRLWKSGFVLFIQEQSQKWEIVTAATTNRLINQLMKLLTAILMIDYSL